MGKIKLIAPFEAYYGNVASKEISSSNYATGIPHYLRICNRTQKNNEGVAKTYTMWPGARTTKPGDAELARRASFKTRAAAVVTRMQSISQSAIDQAAAKAAGMSYRGYVWAQVIAAEDEE